ncbi:MAG: primosomal protein N' [Planctomycetota bacterium]|nr:primosomal protein N' [Planctomycetota bacterium]
MARRDDSLFGQRARDEAARSRFVKVAVERAIDQHEGLTYRLDEGDASVGDRVRVPLGRGGAIVGGVVLDVGGPELLGDYPPEKVRAVQGVTRVSLPGSLVALARWIASYTIAPLGMVLATMTPAAVKKDVGRRTREELARVDVPMPDDLPASVAEAWRAVLELPGDSFPLDADDLMDTLGHTTKRAINRLIALGLLERVAIDSVHARGSGGLGLDADNATLPTTPIITPTRDQQRVIDGIAATLDRFGVHLLRGVTGSGKTEVYLGVIRRVLDAGRSAIVLVPEIALTPQSQERFTARFRDEGVAVLHSGLSASRRNAEWERVRTGAARVVVGARSAVFAPVPRLGVVVVDEEHDSSYKQDQVPRYHGRDVAIKRAQIESCPVILGSATPSLESWANATCVPPRSTLWQLESRVGGGRLPKVEIVDLTLEQRARAAGGDSSTDWSIGPRLRGAIRQTLTEDGQVILLLNRRGFANAVHCSNAACGWVLTCDQCSAAMVFHKDPRTQRGGLVRCHHCLAEQIMPELCPVSGHRLHMLGRGTQRVVEELESLFADLGIVRDTTMLRLDSDTMRRADDYFTALDRFKRGDARLLIGTQMIAKGLDFPGVRLVGVLNADIGAHAADFRSDERSFQIIAQVAGRAGRADGRGLVLVQTYAPLGNAVRFAATHDFLGFAAREMELRARAKLPPITRMARIICRDASAVEARERAAAVAAYFREHHAADVRVNGPTPTIVEKVAGEFRFVVEVIAPRADVLNAALAACRGAGLIKSDAQTAIDVDPVSGI